MKIALNRRDLDLLALIGMHATKVELDCAGIPYWKVAAHPMGNDKDDEPVTESAPTLTEALDETLRTLRALSAAETDQD